MRIVFLDLQGLTSDTLLNANTLWKAVAEALARGVGLPRGWQNDWYDEDRPLYNLHSLLKAIFRADGTPVLLCMDETNRLMNHARKNDFFPRGRKRPGLA